MLSSAALTYGTEVLTAALSLGNALIVARGLGATGRGDVAFLTAVAYLTSSLATIGVQEAIGNIAGRSPNSRRALAGNSVVLSIVFGVIAAGAVAGLVALFPAVGAGSQTVLRWLVLASVPMLILQIFLRYLIQADYRFGVTNLALVVPAILNVAINGTLALIGELTVSTALIVWIAGQALATLLLGAYVSLKLMGFGRPDTSLVRESIAFGAKSHIGRVMLLGNYRMDAWILGGIAGTKELGLYSVAVVWAEACFFLPTALAAVQRPDLVRAGRMDAGRIGATVFRIAITATAGLVIILIVAAPFLCVVIFGEEFRGSVDDLQVLSLGAFGVIAMKQLASALTAQGFPIRSSVAIGVGFAATLILDIVLIPELGGLGAAIASTIAYTMGGLAAAVIFSRTLSLPMMELVPRPGDVSQFARRVGSLVNHRRSASSERTDPPDEPR